MSTLFKQFLSLPVELRNRLAALSDGLSATDLEAGGVATANLADLAVTTGKLAASAVTTAKITDANVTTAKIADANVTTAKLATGVLSADAAGRALVATDFINAATALLIIADAAFAADTATRALFADGIWTAGKLATDSVTTVKIANGNVTLAKLESILAGSAQTLTGAGAVDVVTRTTKYVSDGGAQALTIASGSVTGQRKTIIHSVDGGSGVLTGDLAGLTSITFTNVRDCVELEWNGAAWDVVLYTGVTFI